ncbi:MAG: caspase family protein [Caldilineaceae bacterium]
MTDRFEVGYALLIGVSENAVPKLALPDVAKDIAALQEVLVHPERCAYPADNVKVITGSEATRQGIMDGLDWLYKKLQADGSDNTTAVIYYSGHGWQDTASSPAAYYLIPYDMQAGRYKSRALRANDFAEAIAELRPRRLLLILDCCHAAGIEAKDLDADADIYQESAIPPHILMAGEKAVDVSAATAKDIAALAQGAGRAVLSSCQGTEKSYIRRDRKMSVFTYHLIEALTGHAQPQDGATEVLVSDVMSHVTRTVPESARREAAATQTPDFQISGNFPVSLILGGKGLSKGEPAPDPIADAPGAGTGNIQQSGQTVHGPQTNITGGVQGNVYPATSGRSATAPSTPAAAPSSAATSTPAATSSAATKSSTTARPAQSWRASSRRCCRPRNKRPKTNATKPHRWCTSSKPKPRRATALTTGRWPACWYKLVALVPNAVTAVVGAFGEPLLSAIVGPVTGYVLERLRG